MTVTNINIRITDNRRRRPVRRHVQIPHTDLWTQEWWDSQSNPSASVRQLIQDDVALNGITDVMARAAVPVAVAPVAPAVPAVDPRDAKIENLEQQFTELMDKLGPLMPFFNVITEGKAA
ncbi:MAG: hypothetical protein ABWX92_13445 [Mycetocola sp.]